MRIPMVAATAWHDPTQCLNDMLPAGPILGWWAVQPFQLLVMVGLAITYR